MIARLVGSMDTDQTETPAVPAPPGGDWLNRLRNAAGDQFSGGADCRASRPGSGSLFSRERSTPRPSRRCRSY